MRNNHTCVEALNTYVCVPFSGQCLGQRTAQAFILSVMVGWCLELELELEGGPFCKLGKDHYKSAEQVPSPFSQDLGGREDSLGHPYPSSHNSFPSGMLESPALWKFTPGEPCGRQTECPGDLELGSFSSHGILCVGK